MEAQSTSLRKRKALLPLLLALPIVPPCHSFGPCHTKLQTPKIKKETSDAAPVLSKNGGTVVLGLYPRGVKV